MIVRCVEVTDGILYGKFLVMRMDSAELATPSAMPEAEPFGDRFLTHGGRRRFNDHSTLVIDAQRGTGAAWPLENGEIGMRHFYEKNLKGLDRLVCPMYLSFVLWLHEQGKWGMGRGDITEIPRYIDFREPVTPAADAPAELGRPAPA